MAPRVTFIIVNYRAAALVRLAVEALRPVVADGLAEVTVVDNAGGEDELDALRALPNCTLIANGENLGFGRACNQGIERSQAEFVWLLNPDAEVDAATINAVLAAMDAHPRLGAASPPLVDGTGKPQRAGQSDPSPSNYWRHYSLVSDFRNPPLPRPGQVDWLCGASLCLRRTALLSLGGAAFDPSFFLYFEDADLCRRLRRADWGVELIDCAPARHRAQQSSGGSPQAKRATLEHFYRSFLTYAARWMSAEEQRRLKRTIALDMRLRLLALGLRRGMPPAMRQARRDAYRAIAELVRGK